jgi:predicted enzyme related to lactoylglutathione lyase
MDSVITWHELITTDSDAAARFYADLLGVELEKADMGDFEYTMLKKDGRTHAGFVQQQLEGIPAHWYPYVLVADLDAALERAKAGGAELYHGPVDVGEGLRIGVLGDPQRASFGLMEWNQEPPTGLFAWDELLAADVDEAAGFYGDVVGWTTAPFKDDYRVFNSGETMVGGLTMKQPGMPAAAWLTYLAVGDTDAATAKAEELGATVMMPPTSMEDVGRFSVLTDPAGAVFGLHQGGSQG